MKQMKHPCKYHKKGNCELPAGELCIHKEFDDYNEWCGLNTQNQTKRK